MIGVWIERAVFVDDRIWSHQGDDKTLRGKDDGSLSIRRSTGKRRACSSREADERIGNRRAWVDTRRQPVARDRTRFHLEDSGCPACAATVGPVLDSESQELINRTGGHSSARLLINARERVFIEGAAGSGASRFGASD
ncbi:unnamed protein product [Lasius platythorax]|uniref:Uncharacterized protein n=1 Tax=Lasius platythorax TaxID=488582 RepID=A0AAV2NRB4_9HYME